MKLGKSAWPNRSIDMTLHDLLTKSREEILRIAVARGARNVCVIGAGEQDEVGTEARVELLVDLESGRSILDHAGLLVDLEDLLGCKVEVATERGLRDRLRDRVLREAAPL